jgi:crotonobetainyl-CoA:carnitine CoA-transferase CaiB-like acyl-CoA transferase
MGQFATLCRLLGRPDLAAPPHIPAGLAASAFLSNLATDELRRALAGAFTVAQADALETMLNAEGVPSARVRDLREYLSEVYTDTPGIGVAGEPFTFGPAFRWEGSEATALPPAPRLGADTDRLVAGQTPATGDGAQAG